MSLFKLKTLWSSTFPEQQLDQRHLALGKISKLPAFVVGSFKGVLRVFQAVSMTDTIIRPIFEKDFKEPIIDVKFVRHPDESIRSNTIGVLLFKRFVYLTLEEEKQGGSYSSQSMSVEVEPSFSIISAPLSLTTLNSSIQSLNPKQVHPIKQADPIYPWTVCLNQLYYMDGEDLVKCEGNVEQWRIILGRVKILYLVRELRLVIIGERQLWEVEEGKIIKTKVLEEEVSTGAVAHKPKGEFNILVADFMMHLLIYSQEYTLLWAVKLDYVPIRIIICEDQILRGAMLLLTDSSSLELTYAGSEVQERLLRPIEAEVDLGKVEKETSYYLEKIKQLKANPSLSQNQAASNQQASSSDLIQVKAAFNSPEATSEFVDKSEQYYRQKGSLIKCVLTIELLAHKDPLNNVIVEANPPNNIYLKSQTQKLHVFKGKEVLAFSCFISNEKFPYECSVKVRIRFEKGKVSNLVLREVAIPIKFQCQVDSFESLNGADKKFTFRCTPSELPTFNDLFPDLIERGSGQQKKAMTVVLANGVKSCIVYNKSLTKVKIESEVHSGLCFIFIEFIKRVQQFLQKKNQKPVMEVEVSLKELQASIRQHHSIRQTLKEKYNELVCRTEEFKMTQKKLLLKMKEKNSSVNHIEKLLQYSHQRIIEATNVYESKIEESQIIDHNFQVGLKFIMELVYRRSSASSKARDTAEGIIQFDASASDYSSQEGWAQRITKNSAFYLNKVYEPTAENLQKLVTWVITKVNNGDWND